MVAPREVEADPEPALGDRAFHLKCREEMALAHERGQGQIDELQLRYLDPVPGCVVLVELGVRQHAYPERLLDRGQLDRRVLAERPPGMEHPAEAGLPGSGLGERKRLRAGAPPTGTPPTA